VNVSPVGRYATPPLERMAPRGLAGPSGSAQPPASAAGPAGAREIPVHTPEGTDAQLWSVLTSDERAYFGRAGTRTLVYGPAGASRSLSLNGRALDLKA